MYIGLHVKYRYFFQIVMKLDFSRHIFKKHLNIKFCENISNVSRVFTCGWTDGHTDTTKLTVVFEILRKRLRT
jgi:hypothetical protein